MTTLLRTMGGSEAIRDCTLLDEKHFTSSGFEVNGVKSRDDIKNMLIDGITLALEQRKGMGEYTGLTYASPNDPRIYAKVNTAILGATKQIEHVATARAFPVDLDGGVWRGRDKRNNTQWSIVRGLILPVVKDQELEILPTHWMITQEQKR